MKLRIATGLGLILVMATMIGGPVRVSRAEDDGGGVTLASLAGKFAARGSGFLTICVNAGVPISCSSVSPVPTPVPFNATQIQHATIDAAGNICLVNTATQAPVFGTTSPAAGVHTILVETINTFDPTTGSGTGSGSQYVGGSCNGAVFVDGTVAKKIGTFDFSFDVSDSGNRIEIILTGFDAVTSPFSVAGSVSGGVFSATAIRLRPQD